MQKGRRARRDVGVQKRLSPTRLPHRQQANTLCLPVHPVLAQDSLYLTVKTTQTSWKSGTAVGAMVRKTKIPLKNLHQLHASMVELDERNNDLWISIPWSKLISNKLLLDVLACEQRPEPDPTGHSVF